MNHPFEKKIIMSKREATNERSLILSEFFRNIGYDNYFMDIDFIHITEINRKIVIDAIIEAKLIPFDFDVNNDEIYYEELLKRLCYSDFQRKVLRLLSVQAKIPAYFIVHDNNCKRFLVLRVTEQLNNINWKKLKESVAISKLKEMTQYNNETSTLFSEKDFRHFTKNLRYIYLEMKKSMEIKEREALLQSKEVQEIIQLKVQKEIQKLKEKIF